jgi:hypothetical protein
MFAGKRMELGTIMLSEVSWAQKVKAVCFLICGTQTYETNVYTSTNMIEYTILIHIIIYIMYIIHVKT